MIKGIILDVDGVIVGEKIGFNSPWPHPEVIKALKRAESQGKFISLCTAKPHFAIGKIIHDSGLNNLHITDGGGVIINPIQYKVLKKHVIESTSAKRVLKVLLAQNIYTELYTVDDYFIQLNQVSAITKKHTHILQKEPHKVANIFEEANVQAITKIMPIAQNEKDKEIVTKLFDSTKSNLVLSWGVHPVALPLQFGIITAPGISKAEGAKEIVKFHQTTFDHMLGVGDSTSDWQFISLCKYAAAMGNASQELKKLVASRGKQTSFIGPTVNDNGVIAILNHFLN